MWLMSNLIMRCALPAGSSPRKYLFFNDLRVGFACNMMIKPIINDLRYNFAMFLAVLLLLLSIGAGFFTALLFSVSDTAIDLVVVAISALITTVLFVGAAICDCIARLRSSISQS